MKQARATRYGIHRGGALLALFLHLLAGTALGGVVHVPADSLTIQAAVAGAADGDTVVVAPGTYTGEGNRDIRFFDRSVTVLGEGGAEATKIDCGGEDRAFYIDQCPQVKIRIVGLTVVGGNAGDGAAIYCRNNDPEIADCVFTENVANDDAGALYFYDSVPLIDRCVFAENEASDDGGALYLSNSDPVMFDCTISANIAGSAGGGIYAYYSDPTLNSCNIVNNEAGDSGGGIDLYSSSAAVIDS